MGRIGDGFDIGPRMEVRGVARDLGEPAQFLVPAFREGHIDIRAVRRLHNPDALPRRTRREVGAFQKEDIRHPEASEVERDARTDHSAPRNDDVRPFAHGGSLGQWWFCEKG